MGACPLSLQTPSPILGLHAPPDSSLGPVPQSPHYTPNRTCPSLLTLPGGCSLSTPLPPPPDPDPSTASPPTFNTYSPSPAVTGSPGIVKAPARPRAQESPRLARPGSAPSR